MRFIWLRGDIAAEVGRRHRDTALLAAHRPAIAAPLEGRVLAKVVTRPTGRVGAASAAVKARGREEAGAEGRSGRSCRPMPWSCWALVLANLALFLNFGQN